MTMRNLTPLKAIRQKCLECAGRPSEVRKCEVPDCPLFIYRFGGSNTTVIYINAVDAASFADIVRRNPGTIISAVEDSLNRNSNIKR